MSWLSPIFALSWLTVPAATPRASSIASAAMPAPSFPTPASLKKTLESGTSSANSPELTPPCEADTTCAPASSGTTFVIESMITTCPFSPFRTVVFNMVAHPFIRGESAAGLRSPSGGLRGVADVLDGLQHRLGIEHPLQPVLAEDDRLRLRDGVQRTVREPSFGEDLERDRQPDVEVAQHEIDRGFARHAAAHRLVGRLPERDAHRDRDRFRKRRLQNGD